MFRAHIHINFISKCAERLLLCPAALAQPPAPTASQLGTLSHSLNAIMLQPLRNVTKLIKTLRRFPSESQPDVCTHTHTHTHACRDTCVYVCGMYSMYVMYPGECERRMRIRHRTGPRPRMSVQCDCEYSSYTRRQRCDVDAG